MCVGETMWGAMLASSSRVVVDGSTIAVVRTTITLLLLVRSILLSLFLVYLQ